MKRSEIEIEGVRYLVHDNLGFQHSAGVFAKEVHTIGGPRIAVRDPGGSAWRFWTAKDRLQPGAPKVRAEQPDLKDTEIVPSLEGQS